ncbi:zinc finger protein ZPR1 [Diorhabda sublineata]|uniref:zinc finger protein ZPR1 n=1 Tax=Diorhabda sublineata TaxID=1163346 RepID=UPI0024E0C576|nr:zinc finger protein ZPR1 [Diorhabda sublineata]
MGSVKPIFRDLNADDPEPETTEIESLCMNCHENGMTRLLLTKIPFFKELVLMSFTCEHCGYQNNEIQSGAPVADKGVRISLNVMTKKDLNRQVVKSDYTSVKIAELDFEIPSKSQKGEVTTVEGIIDRSITGLEQDQPLRRIQFPETAAQIDDFINKLKSLKEVETPFVLILEDISGNSFIENPNAPRVDSSCTTSYFTRSKEQNHELGIFTQDEIIEEKESNILHPIEEGEFTLDDLEGEVLQFPTNCPSCNSPCQTNMKMTNIPHFKEVVIMATNCDICGLKTNEVKSGSGIEPKGLKIEVDVKSKEDFSRDVLKSETCSLSIPQLDLEVGPHALGGRFTTIEGLLQAMKDQLCDPKHSHMFGDSVDPKSKKEFETFLEKFDEILKGNLMVTVILDDPAGNSYIQTMRDDDQPDDNLRILHYERSFDQNEELGLNDLNTENYEA